MYPSRTLILIFLLWFEMAENQWWNGYNVGASVDPYSQYHMCEQAGYDYTQYLQLVYPNSYSQPFYDYQYYSYNPYQDDQQKPIIIILNSEDHDDDWELFDLISLIASLKDKPDNEPIYIPYPVSVPCCSCDYDYDFEWDINCYSDCDCRKKGKCNSCKNKKACCDCDDCGDHRKRGRSKSKCHSSGNSRSKSDRGRCNKCDSIKHKCDCCY